MPEFRGIRTLALMAACIATPAMAQTSSTAHGTPHATTAGTVHQPAHAEVGRLERSHGGWRSSRIVGASVYNDQDQSIGTISDLIVGQDGKISEAVISVGGFLGIGSKLVGVPFDQLRFNEKSAGVGGRVAPVGNGAAAPAGTGAGAPMGVGAGTGIPPTNGAGTAAGTAGATGPGVGAAPVAGAPLRPGPANLTTTRIELPGATKDSLKGMPSFSYEG